MQPQIELSGLLSADPLARLHAELQVACDEAASRLLLARCPLSGSCVAVMTVQGVVASWWAHGPLDTDQARIWADTLRDSVFAAAAATAEPLRTH
jgi:hypothetical protein